MTIPRPPRTVRLEQWAVHADPYAAPETEKGRIYLSGEVYGYPDRPDGDKVSTGHIYGAEGRVAWGKRTAYELGTPAPTYLAWLEERGMVYDVENPIRMVGGDK